MMFDNDTDGSEASAETSSAERGEAFENELERAQPAGERLHDHLPLVAMLIGLVALFFGLHGAGSVVVGVAAAHLVLGLVLVVVGRTRSSRNRSAR